MKRRIPNDLCRIYPEKKQRRAYTPAYAVAPIIKYIPENKIVWCPFDTEHSEYVLALKAAGIRVVHSHILTGEDFFVYEPEEWDLIVSNPPFRIKQKEVERCLALGKPFALLLSNLWLNSSAPVHLFREKEMQMLLFDKRIQFTEKNAAYFGSSYFCWEVLPRQIVFENLNRSKYEESRMADDMRKLIKPLMNGHE